MSHNIRPVESRDVSIQYSGIKHGEGAFEWTPHDPAKNGIDQDKFNEELKIAAVISRIEEAEVWWYHNGIKVSSEFILHQPNPWAWLTEQNSEMAN